MTCCYVTFRTVMHAPLHIPHCHAYAPSHTALSCTRPLVTCHIPCHQAYTPSHTLSSGIHPCLHTGKYGVYPSDPAWQRMAAFAARLNRLFGTASACVAPTNAPAYPPAPCPAGFEGASCQTDVNECARGTDTCPDNAACTNTVGGYECTCWPGYVQVGASCERDATAVEVGLVKTCRPLMILSAVLTLYLPSVQLATTSTSVAISTARVATWCPGPRPPLVLPTTRPA